MDNDWDYYLYLQEQQEIAAERNAEFFDTYYPRWETEEVAREARNLVSETDIHPIQREF